MAVKLGRTGVVVNKTGFGAPPVRRCATGEAVNIPRGAFDAGINYFDTARMYTDSEEKIGLALSPVRGQIVLAIKTAAANGAARRHSGLPSIGGAKWKRSRTVLAAGIAGNTVPTALTRRRCSKSTMPTIKLFYNLEDKQCAESRDI